MGGDRTLARPLEEEEAVARARMLVVGQRLRPLAEELGGKASVLHPPLVMVQRQLEL